MRGFPESFSTKQDFLNGIATYPEETKAELRHLIAGRFEFVQTGVLAEGEEGLHYIQFAVACVYYPIVLDEIPDPAAEAAQPAETTAESSAAAQ